MVTILDGKIVAEGIRAQLREKVKTFSSVPCLAIIQIGNDKRSSIYIKNKKSFGESIGVEVRHIELIETITKTEVEKVVDDLNNDNSVHGIIMQLPIPQHLDKDLILNKIKKEKDVDGLSLDNLIHTPATARGVMTLLNAYNIKALDKKAVVIGRSRLVGIPVAECLRNAGAHVTVCHRETQDIPSITKQADIIIVAAGVPNLITKDYVKNEQVIIDVGINSITNELDNSNHLVGDVDFQSISPIVAAISPVPGGVGPLTVASLFQNLYDAFAHFTR